MRGLVNNIHDETKDFDSQPSTNTPYETPSLNPIYDVTKPSPGGNPVYFKNLQLNASPGNEECYDTLQRNTISTNKAPVQAAANGNGYSNLTNVTGGEYSHLGQAMPKTGKKLKIRC